MHSTIDFSYIFSAIFLTVYGQLILKWRIIQYGMLPTDIIGKFKFILLLFSDPLILSGFFAAFLASIAWMFAMTKFELSYAYSFMSLNFVFVLFLSLFLLNESISFNKLAGIAFIVLGTILVGQSSPN